MSDTTPIPPASERERFEAWVLDTYNYGYSLTRSSEVEGAYVHDGTDMAWDAWQARAALSHSSTPQEWQPIESAPKDGTHILLANKAGTSEGGWLSDIDHGADWEGQIGMAGWWRADGTDWPNSHWQPLPDPPEQGGKG